MYHPNNQHNGGGPLPISPVDHPLYVVTCISNSKRYRSRYHLYRRFEQYIANSGAILYTIEQSFGDRQHEVTYPDNPRHIQVNATSELWYKENMLNLAIQHLPSDWKYVAWLDADIEFVRPDWVFETIHLLQHYDIIQMFSQATDLDPQYKVLSGVRDGIISSWRHNKCGPLSQPHDEYNYDGIKGYSNGARSKHPGYAWAARRDAFDKLGGLIDWAVVGSADWHMATALIGQVEESLPHALVEACPDYAKWCVNWQQRAVELIKYNVGYMDGLVFHHWHGKKTDRKYADRWRILVDNKFNPMSDLKKDWQGLWQLSGNNHKLRDDLREYLALRNEDSIDK